MRDLLQPVLADESFLADVADARAQRRNDGRLDLWWLGQSGFLIGWRDRHLLVDPYLSDSLTRKYTGTEKPHVRMTARVVDPALLHFVDVVTASHAHTDHLDPETLRPLLGASPDAALVAPEAERGLVADRAGVPLGRPIGLDPGTTVEVSGFSVTAVRAAHEEIEHDAQGHTRHLGYVFRFGPFAVYHSGDTLRFAGMASAVRRAASGRAIDVALLPINGRAPERRVAGNLDGEEAAALAHELPARLAIPCHFEMFEFNTATPDAFALACRRLGQPYAVLGAGARRTVIRGG
jgi:L-ascorbate metabolism protein UlaG (beta-lactamase superfamily)